MSSESILHMQDISKHYPGVLALNRVNFAVQPGEVHALVGENGAGKSTLMKILAGAERMDEGRISIQGRPVTIDNPLKAQQLGVSIIYQEFNLIPQLGVAANIFLGREINGWGFIRSKEERRQAQNILNQLGVELDLNKPVERFSVAQQQMVEIAKALSVEAKIIAMDEPSATLTHHELRNLFQLVKTLKQRGISVVYISHRLEEIFEVCDRLTVLRDGEWVATKSIDEVDREFIIEMMVGRKITEEFPKETFSPGDEILRVEGLSRERVQDVSFNVRQGEIVGLTGLVGAGRTEVARMIFGVDAPERGGINFCGRQFVPKFPRQAIDRGICMLTEDRKNQGLILEMNVRENITLPTLREFCRFGLILRKAEKQSADQFIQQIAIKTPSSETEVRNLSGGNQQKVVLAKWLLAHSKLFIFDEPTRGIDVGAKREIYLMMNELLRRGAAVLMISSELPEVLGMADRILVMNRGRLSGELPHAEATQQKIVDLATRSDSESASAA